MAHKLSCPDCGASVPAGHVNLDLLVASCPGCDAVFGFGEHVGHRADEGEAAAVGEVSTLVVPEGITEDKGPSGLVLSVSWSTVRGAIVGVFAIIWNGMLAFMASMMLSNGQVEAVPFMGLHAAAGLGMLYYAAACFLNSTEITVNTAGIDVAHGPLWWPGARTLPAAQLDQLYVEKRIIRGKNGSSTVYDLKASGRGGQRLKVAPGLHTFERARYLERRIEAYLGIEDRPVAGEHRA